MRRVILPMIALSLAAAPLAVEAQTPAERPARAQQGVRWMYGMNPAERVLQHRDALGLTAEQVTRLQEVQARFAAQNQPLLAQVQAVRPQGARAPGERAQRGERRGEVRQRMQQRMEQLTPEQREAMQQRREQLRNATPEQRQQMRQQMREEMQQRMEQLTPEQRQQLRQRRDSLGMKPMRGRDVTPEQRAQLEALRPVFEQLRQNHEQAREQVHAILTAEQQARLRELNTQRRGEPRQGARQGTRR